MKARFSYLTIGLLIMANSAYSQSSFKVLDSDTTAKPVSKYLYGGIWETSCGRSDLLWGEMLNDRGFESSRSLNDNSWLSITRGTPQKEDWWHSGYLEPKWYQYTKEHGREPVKKEFDGYWPAAHGKYFVKLDNRKSASPIYLAQDTFYVKKGATYNFSALMCEGTFISQYKESKNPVQVKITLAKPGKPDEPFASQTIVVNTNQLNMYSCTIPTEGYEGWATFAIEVPARKTAAFDLLSMMQSNNVKGWRGDAVKKLRDELKIRMIRYPGGCYASFYDWRDGIGPKENRPVSYDTFWGANVINDCGTVEIAELCHAIGAEPMLCVPVMLYNDTFNAAEWVDFCNNPNNARRIACGAKEPLNVKYWEMDNENYRRLDAITYAQRCVEFSKAMKAVDPSINIIMGNYWIFNSRFAEMLQVAGKYVDVITNRGGSVEEMKNDLKILAEYNKRNGTDIILCHTEFRAPLHRKSPRNDDGLNNTHNDTQESLFNSSVRWDFAMSVLNQFVEYQNMGGDFLTAIYTQMNDGWGESVINVAREGSYLSASGVVIKLLSKLDVVYPQKVEANDPTKDIVIQAAWNKERNKLTLLLVNYNSKATSCRLDLSDFNKKFDSKAKSYEIAPPSAGTFNTLEQPDRVKIVEGSAKIKKRMNVVLKPNSVYAVEVKVQK
jgi:alpha-N-arabinofuranosidase